VTLTGFDDEGSDAVCDATGLLYLTAVRLTVFTVKAISPTTGFLNNRAGDKLGQSAGADRRAGPPPRQRGFPEAQGAWRAPAPANGGSKPIEGKVADTASS